MSEFRLFCTTLFIALGLLSAAHNREIVTAADGAAGLLMIAVAFASLVVMFFGKRGDA